MLQFIDDAQGRILLEMIELMPYDAVLKASRFIRQDILRDILKELIENIIKRLKKDAEIEVIPVEKPESNNESINRLKLFMEKYGKIILSLAAMLGIIFGIIIIIIFF